MSGDGARGAVIPPAPSATLRELTRWRLALLLLTVLTTVALHHAYQGVHADAGPLRTSSAPGILAVDTAMNALADADSGVALEQGSAAGDFQTNLSVADQSLARAAAADVTGLPGRQTIQTVTGLISTYSDWIEDALGQPAHPVLQKAYLRYARDMLGTPRAKGSAADATIMGRLTELRAQQEDVLRRQSRFGPLLWAEWSVAAVSALALAVLFAGAHAYSGARFRRRWNPALALGVLLAAGGAAVLAVFTALTQAALSDARDRVTAALAEDEIPTAGAAVAARLAGTGFRAAAGDWIWAGGLVLAALVLLGLQPRVNEYRAGRVRSAARRWRTPRPRALGAAAGCLVLLAAGGAYAVQATGWHGSVTLLANWTGDQQDEFQRKVIDRFEDEYRIHVVYEGSSAESQVLAADVKSGTPPDVAVLPGPGELAGYAGKGLLTPLDDVVRPAGFGATWVPEVKGRDGVPHTYWVPIKTDLKSMVWYPPARVAAGDVAEDARDPAAWCLGMADDATSGWPGSDWIEDILLQQSGPATYQKWVAGKVRWTDPAVRRAWTTWGGMVGAGRAPYAQTALTTSFDDAEHNATPGHGPCELEHQASFARGGRDFVPSATVIPGADTSGPERWEVSGDLAAVLHDTEQSHKLIGYLASAEAQRAWAGTQLGFSVEHGVLAGYRGDGTTAGRIVTALRDPGAVRCYDASDAMPTAVREAFDHAVLRYLADPSALDTQLSALDQTTHRAAAQTRGLTSVCSGGGA